MIDALKRLLGNLFFVVRYCPYSLFVPSLSAFLMPFRVFGWLGIARSVEEAVEKRLTWCWLGGNLNGSIHLIDSA